jgi:putative membrane protein
MHLMCAGIAAAIIISAYRPEEVDDWAMENSLVFVFVGVLIATYRRLPLSDVSCLCIFFFLSLHEWGAHYKYSDVPLGEWMKPWLGTMRNHYDRVAHFSYGLLCTYPLQELAMRTGVRNRWRYVLPVALILSFSALYEMLEAFMASILTPERGEEFVGMQGDMWDSQKDMFVAALGAVIAMVAVAVIRRRRAAPAAAEEPAAVYRPTR